MKLVKICIILFSVFSLSSCSLLGGGTHQKCSAYSQNFEKSDNELLFDENVEDLQMRNAGENI